MADATGASNNSYIQLLSTTSLEQALPDFVVSRTATLFKYPPEIDPTTLLSVLHEPYNVPSPKCPPSSSSSGTTQAPAGGAAGALEVDTSGSAASDGNLGSLVEKYGRIGLGLLAGNLVFTLLLLIVGLVARLRGVIKTGARTRNISPSYAPVRFKDVESTVDETYRDSN